jgi:hypothetical protein
MAVTSVDSAASDTALLGAATASRRKVIIENSDANRLHVLLDAGVASATNYSFSLAQYGVARLPEDYVGVVRGCWAANGSGAAHITTYEG